MIPKNIIQICIGPDNNDTKYLRHLSKGWSIAYPDWNILLCDDDMVEQSVAEYSNDALAAYHKIKVLTYRADLARLILLYKYGGVYIDLDTRPAAPLIPYTVVSDEMQWGMLICIENNQIITNNHLVASEPRNSLIKGMIDGMVQSILEVDISQLKFEDHRHSRTWVAPIVSTEAWARLLLKHINNLIGEDYLDKHLSSGAGTVGWFWLTYDGEKVSSRKYRDNVIHIGSLTLKDFVDTNPLENPMSKIAELYSDLDLSNSEIKIYRGGADGL